MNRITLRMTFQVVLLVALLSACTSAAATTDPATPTEESTMESIPAEIPTAEPTRTPLPTATRTLQPSATPSPTDTEVATSAAESGITSSNPTERPGEPATASTIDPSQTTPPATTANTGEVVPPGQSVWQLDNSPSEFGSSEKCPSPIYHDFYGLVAVNTVDGGISWRSQDGITYTLLRQSPNVFWGTGGSILPGYTLTISVVFTSPTGLGVTYVLIDQAIEGCNHYFRYGGTRAW